MKKKLLFLLVLLSLSISALETASSYRGARKKALRDNKKILICFTGSDWNPDGTDTLHHFLNTNHFQQMAGSKVVLYKADLPKYKKLGQEAEDDNRRLTSRYGITVFPSLILIDPRWGSLLVKQAGFKNANTRELYNRIETALYGKKKKAAGRK